MQVAVVVHKPPKGVVYGRRVVAREHGPAQHVLPEQKGDHCFEQWLPSVRCALPGVKAFAIALEVMVSKHQDLATREAPDPFHGLVVVAHGQVPENQQPFVVLDLLDLGDEVLVHLHDVEKGTLAVLDHVRVAQVQIGRHPYPLTAGQGIHDLRAGLVDGVGPGQVQHPCVHIRPGSLRGQRALK